MFDLDTFLMSLYLIGFNDRNAFCSAEPLGPGADPYQAMNGLSDPGVLDSPCKGNCGLFLLEGRRNNESRRLKCDLMIIIDFLYQ